MGSTSTICAVSDVESKDFSADVLFTALKYDAVSLRKGYCKPKSTCNNNLLQKAICCPQFVIHCK